MVLLNEGPSELQIFLERLNDSACMFVVHFPLKNCKTLFRDWIGSKLNPVLAGGQMSVVDPSGYLGSCASPDGRRSVFAHTEGSNGIHYFEATMSSA